MEVFLQDGHKPGKPGILGIIREFKATGKYHGNIREFPKVSGNSCATTQIFEFLTNLEFILNMKLLIKYFNLHIFNIK